MAGNQNFADNHADEAIPVEERVSGFQVAQISVGVAITLPAFLIAAETFSALGVYRGLIALAAAALLLFCVSSGAMIVGARTRATTYAIIRSVFGSTVALGINFLIGLVLLGWFAVTVSIFGSALNGALTSVMNVTLPLWLAKAAGGALMTIITLYGFQAIYRLSRLIVPLLAITLIAAFAATLSRADMDALLATEGKVSQIGSIGEAISILVGAFMVGVTIVPDLSRFLKSAGHGVAASAMSYGFGSQVVFILSGVPALITSEKDFVANLLLIGFGWPALFVVTFATLTTNVSNLYSVSLSFRQVFPKLRDFQVTMIAGLLGTGVALWGIENTFIPFLMFLAVAIPPIAGAYITHFLTQPEGARLGTASALRWQALVAWLVGVLIALATTNHWFDLTHIPAIDGFLTSALLYWAVSKVFSDTQG